MNLPASVARNIVGASCVVLLGCGPQTLCGAGTHRVAGENGVGTCVADEDSDTSGTGDTGEMDPTVPADPENPFANCARLVVGSYADGGAVSYAYYIDYDAWGDWVLQTKDGDANGSYEESWLAVYSADRTQMTEDYDDEDANATADSRYEFNYRSDGQMSSWRVDSGADGTYDDSWTYTYDDSARVVGIDVDEGMDGVTDGVETWAWTEVESGLSSRAEWDYPLDGVADSVEVDTYNTVPVEGSRVGQRTGAVVDNDADGVDDYVYAYEYDADGNRWAYGLVVYEAGAFSYSYRMESTFDTWGRYYSSQIRYDEANADSDYDIANTYTCW